MDKAEISRIVGYGSAFLFVDRVLDLTDDRIEIATVFPSDLPIVEAHIVADERIVPGVILIEMVAQGARLLTHGQGGGGKNTGSWVIARASGSFVQKARPDREVRGIVTRIVAGESSSMFEGTLRQGDQLIASAKIYSARIA